MNAAPHRISVDDKSFPPGAWGLTDDEFVASAPRLSDFQTPLLTLDRGAMEHNVATMTAWTAERGLLLAPHGKTTMAPKLWWQLLDAGAWAITVATGWQAQVARAAGVPRILLANELVDPVALRWLAAEVADPELEVLCWADSVDAVDAMRAALRGHPPARPIRVLVELGGAGGRAGARTLEDGLAAARAIAAAPSSSSPASRGGRVRSPTTVRPTGSHAFVPSWMTWSPSRAPPTGRPGRS